MAYFYLLRDSGPPTQTIFARYSHGNTLRFAISILILQTPLSTLLCPHSSFTSPQCGNRGRGVLYSSLSKLSCQLGQHVANRRAHQPHQPRPAVHALRETHAFAPPRQPRSELHHRPCRRLHMPSSSRSACSSTNRSKVCSSVATLPAVLAAIPTDFVNAAQSAARASADTGALATGLALSRCA